MMKVGMPRWIVERPEVVILSRTISWAMNRQVSRENLLLCGEAASCEKTIGERAAFMFRQSCYIARLL